VVGAHGVDLVRRQVVGTVRAERLLVGDGQVDQRAVGPEALVGQPAGGHRHRGGQVEHVDGAAAPHLAVDQLAAERVAPPTVRTGRHHVGVAHEQQARRVGSPPLDAGHEAAAAGRRLEALDIDPRPVEVSCQQVRAPDLAARSAGAVVDARVPDEVLQQVGDLGGEGAHRPAP
jgi:hypothetical protein